MADTLQKFRDRGKQEKDDLDFPTWCQRYIYLREGKFSFDMHPELKQLYADDHPEMVIRKCVQAGASTYAINRMLWLSCKKAMKSFYAVPTDKFAESFTPDRINPIIKHSAYLKERLGDVNGTFLKQIGYGSIYIQGLTTDAKVASADIDFLIIDEADIVNQVFKIAAEDRLQHSLLAYLIQLSKCTVPGYGVDELFKEKSDKHYYMFICPHCGTYNNVVENIVKADKPTDVIRRKVSKGKVDYYFACQKCKKPLDPTIAEWVPEYPGRDVRGYQLSQVYWTWKIPKYKSVAEKLWKKYVEAEKSGDLELMKFFWRSLIGVAFAGDEQRLTLEILKAMAGNHALVPGWTGPTFMGVDNSDKKHVAIAHQEGYRLVFHFFACKNDIKPVYRYMKAHNVKRCCIDALPNKDTARDLAEEFKKRVYLQYFKNVYKNSEEEDVEPETVPFVQVNRTDTLDALTKAIASGEVVIPGENAGAEITEVRKHLLKLIREKVATSDGQQVYKYKTDVANHYGMAMNSAVIAWKMFLKEAPTTGRAVYPVGVSLHGN